MKQLSSFMVININGGDRISYTYDEIDSNTGEPISVNNKKSFYVVDNNLSVLIDQIKDYIKLNKLSED